MKPTPNRVHEDIVFVAERQKVEYDRFGPWTYPVTSPDEMPPRFDAWYDEFKSSALMLKLPKAVERRVAKPGSDLYEGLLTVGSSGISYLSLNRGEVLRRDVHFGDIVAVRMAQELLSGTLRIDLADGGALAVSFNTVSADLLGDFVDQVRAACGNPAAWSAAAAGGASTNGRPRFGKPSSRLEPAEDDTLFQILLRALRRRDPGYSVLAYQTPCVLQARRESGRRGLFGVAARLLRWRLDGCLLAAVPSELVLLTRGTGRPRSGRSKGYRYEITYLPAASFRGAVAAARSLSNGAMINTLRISAPGHDYELTLEAAPSAALAALGSS